MLGCLNIYFIIILLLCIVNLNKLNFISSILYVQFNKFSRPHSICLIHSRTCSISLSRSFIVMKIINFDYMYLWDLHCALGSLQTSILLTRTSASELRKYLRLVQNRKLKNTVKNIVIRHNGHKSILRR